MSKVVSPYGVTPAVYGGYGHGLAATGYGHGYGMKTRVEIDTGIL